MGSGMSFQVKCIIEALATEGAEVSFDVAVTLDVAVEETLQGEDLLAHLTDELVVCSLDTWYIGLLRCFSTNVLLRINKNASVLMAC